MIKKFIDERENIMNYSEIFDKNLYRNELKII